LEGLNLLTSIFSHETLIDFVLKERGKCLQLFGDKLEADVVNMFKIFVLRQFNGLSDFEFKNNVLIELFSENVLIFLSSYILYHILIIQEKNY
jgi:hypothetical protein